MLVRCQGSKVITIFHGIVYPFFHIIYYIVLSLVTFGVQLLHFIYGAFFPGDF